MELVTWPTGRDFNTHVDAEGNDVLQEWAVLESIDFGGSRSMATGGPIDACEYIPAGATAALAASSGMGAFAFPVTATRHMW